MASVEHTIDINVPVSTAYNQWTQFESFPQFMEGVESVQQLDNKTLHWRAKVGGKVEEWDAAITEQVPDQIIAWQSTDGAPNGGRVTFQPIGADVTRVMLRMEYDPQGFVESVGDALGFASRRIQGDLNRYKEFIESRGTETGAWRGQIQGGQPAGAGRGTSGTGGAMGTPYGGTTQPIGETTDAETPTSVGTPRDTRGAGYTNRDSKDRY